MSGGVVVMLMVVTMMGVTSGMINRQTSVPIGAEWLNSMPGGQDWTPPASPAQPVKEVHFKTCKQGVTVVEYLYAEIRQSNLGKGTDTNQAIRTWVQNTVGRKTDDAGHIIGKNQGGLGTVQWNIFPQNKNFNRGVYASDVERLVNQAVQNNGLVKLWFQFVYDNSAEPCRPTHFKYYIDTASFSANNDLLNP